MVGRCQVKTDVLNRDSNPRQPSKPEIRPFSEARRSKSVPVSPSPGPTTNKQTKRTRDTVQSDYFKDRSYMSDVYSWARIGEVNVNFYLLTCILCGLTVTLE